MLVPLLLNNLLSAAGASVAVTGTTAFTEAQVVAGGEQTIITLTGDTWIAAGTDPIGTTAESLSIIAGITSAQSETFGWNNEVRDKEVVGALVRTSDTQATITWTTAPAYNVTSNETITVTVPAAVLTAAAQLVATPTIGITADVVASVVAAGGGSYRHFGIDYEEQEPPEIVAIKEEIKLVKKEQVVLRKEDNTETMLLALADRLKQLQIDLRRQITLNNRYKAEFAKAEASRVAVAENNARMKQAKMEKRNRRLLTIARLLD